MEKRNKYRNFDFLSKKSFIAQFQCSNTVFLDVKDVLRTSSEFTKLIWNLKMSNDILHVMSQLELDFLFDSLRILYFYYTWYCNISSLSSTLIKATFKYFYLYQNSIASWYFWRMLYTYQWTQTIGSVSVKYKNSISWIWNIVSW